MSNLEIGLSLGFIALLVLALVFTKKKKTNPSSGNLDDRRPSDNPKEKV